jgi:hypothetical protein
MSQSSNPKNEVQVRSFYADIDGLWYMIYRYPNSNEPNRSYRLILESYTYPTIAIVQDFAKEKLNLGMDDDVHVREILRLVNQDLRRSTERPRHYMLNTGDKSMKQKIATAELDYLVLLMGKS